MPAYERHNRSGTFKVAEDSTPLVVDSVSLCPICLSTCEIRIYPDERYNYIDCWTCYLTWVRNEQDQPGNAV